MEPLMTESSRDKSPGSPHDILNSTVNATLNMILASQGYFNGLIKYYGDFLSPFDVAWYSFNAVERQKLTQLQLWQSYVDYLNLYLFNQQVADKGSLSSLSSALEYHVKRYQQYQPALLDTWLGKDGQELAKLAQNERRLIEKVIYEYPKAIQSIEPEYGFNFDQPGYALADETDRFCLYQVLPNAPDVECREKGKPVLIIPPYVLGANILAFLPGEGKSYVHSYANQGIPTYIRIMKPIDETPAVQVMTGEDDTLDTRRFCQFLQKKHHRQITLNGFCQGGFIGVVNLLTGKLDGLVDALITCVAPLDGTRSKSLVEYLQHLPARFRDLGYAVKILPNGNQVVDGNVMSWVYKLKSMEREAPLFTFYRDLVMLDRPNDKSFKISKTAAAINYWLLYDRTDLPRDICQMSFDSFTVPVTQDGTLPIMLFNRSLNFKRLNQKGIRFLICYADKDDLVDKDAALAPLDYIDAEVTVFPKGHGAIATSWSHPKSECALHTRFGNNYRGPVRFQLDLENES
jgi:hypothetical protein